MLYLFSTVQESLQGPDEFAWKFHVIIGTPITVNAFLIDVSYSRVTSVPSVPEMLGSEQTIEDRGAHIKVQVSFLA